MKDVFRNFCEKYGTNVAIYPKEIYYISYSDFTHKFILTIFSGKFAKISAKNNVYKYSIKCDGAEIGADIYEDHILGWIDSDNFIPHQQPNLEDYKWVQYY